MDGDLADVTCAHVHVLSSRQIIGRTELAKVDPLPVDSDALAHGGDLRYRIPLRV